MDENQSFFDELAAASWPELETLWQNALRGFMTEIAAPENYDQAAEAVRADPFTKALEVDWITLPSAAREERYARLLEVVQRAGYQTRPYCTKCGACCHGSSPSLFTEDIRLFEDGIVTREQVYTLRAGERVRLPLGLGTMLLTDEAIKLREDSATGHCVFFDAESNDCRIYLERPLQCRAQACWDTGDVQHVLKKGKKLSRADVVGTEEPVAPALVAHESHCSVVGLNEAFEDAANGREDGVEVVIDALAYDAQLRPLLTEKLPLPAGELDFYFGRPLTRVVEQFGIRVVSDDDGFRLEPIAPPSSGDDA